VKEKDIEEGQAIVPYRGSPRETRSLSKGHRLSPSHLEHNGEKREIFEAIVASLKRVTGGKKATSKEVWPEVRGSFYYRSKQTATEAHPTTEKENF